MSECVCVRERERERERESELEFVGEAELMKIYKHFFLSFSSLNNTCDRMYICMY